MTLNHLLATILGMSLTAAIAILVVLPIRAMLRKIKAPALIRYALWAVILFRLLCPVSFSSEFSLFSWDILKEPAQIAESMAAPPIGDGVPGVQLQQVGPVSAPESILPVSPLPDQQPQPAWPRFSPALIWLSGVLVLLGYYTISYLRLRRTVSMAVCAEKNIYRSDCIGSPFVCGLVHPRIYLPCNLGENEYEYILLHEQIHVKRLDYLLKPLWLAACCLHWFNPLAWLAFSLMCEDMELSCDEAVLKKLGDAIKADYSRSLIALATQSPAFGGVLPGFGQHKTKSRVNNVLNYKKPLAGAVVLAVAVVAVTACALTTNAPPPEAQEVAALPEDAPDEQPKPTDEELQRFVEERLAAYQEMAADNPLTKPEADAPQPGDHQFGWPYTGAIKATFGARSMGYHSGIDIIGPIGDAVAAAEAGEVILAEWYYAYGNCVMIDHGNGLETWYGHLSAYAVQAGDMVERGQIIGAIGNTGRSDEPHLHFEVRDKSAAYDPLSYLENESNPENEEAPENEA